MTSNHEILGSTPSVSIFVPFCPPGLFLDYLFALTVLTIVHCTIENLYS
jgi:hypothetical protein